MTPEEFSRRVLEWFAVHGRKDLPWQREPTPYRVWISEIMLQQTQVATVIPYYERFMARFSDERALAAADLDEVLHLWAGLGYYARARNLHRAARLVCERHGGRLPEDIEELAALPGIGRSTAGAILALALNHRHPILDGNVKRVLARFHAVEGWPGRSAVARRLWRLAEQYTPRDNVAAYTQAMMDLGAKVCIHGRPACGRCPVAEGCAARREGRQEMLPSPRPRKELVLRSARMLLLCNDAHDVLLVRRPPTGVWGGMWSLPEIPEGEEPAEWCRTRLGCRVNGVEAWPPLLHTFTHFRLEIRPLLVRVKDMDFSVMEGDGAVWYNTREPDGRGVPAPVRRLLERLANRGEDD